MKVSCLLRLLSISALCISVASCSQFYTRVYSVEHDATLDPDQTEAIAGGIGAELAPLGFRWDSRFSPDSDFTVFITRRGDVAVAQREIGWEATVTVSVGRDEIVIRDFTNYYRTPFFAEVERRVDTYLKTQGVTGSFRQR